MGKLEVVSKGLKGLKIAWCEKNTFGREFQKAGTLGKFDLEK